jgi:hypothetical protein
VDRLAQDQRHDRVAGFVAGGGFVGKRFHVLNLRERVGWANAECRVKAARCSTDA